MKIKPTYSGTVLEGQLTLDHKTSFKRYLRSLGDVPVLVTVEKVSKKRSNAQNALYWMYLTIIASDTGEEPEDLHLLFKRKFLPVEEIAVMNNTLKRIKSTTKLDKLEFTEYLAKIEQMTEIPIPDTVAFNRYRETAPLK